MVIDTNKWLPGGQKVLISPISLGEPDWQQQNFPINLTLERVKHSPSLDEHQPVSHEYETQLFKYYGYGSYWMGSDLWGTYPHPPPLADVKVLEDATQLKVEDRHLRSTEAIKGYSIQARDKKIGHIDDFIFNTDNWTIPYIVIDTNNWLPGGRKILISRQNIESINWEARTVTVALSAEKIQDSPLFEPEMNIDDAYESALNKYYGISQD